jgi:hypothetical protein
MHKRMKVLLHKIKWILIAFFIGILVFLLALFLRYNFGWPKYFDNKAIIEICDSINTTNTLPNNFYEIYDKLFPRQRHTGILKTYTWGFVYELISGNNDRLVSPTVIFSWDYYTNLLDNKRGTIYYIDNKIFLSFAIDKYTSPEKCFDFILNRHNFSYNQIGIFNASRYYYKKDLEKLTVEEIIGLIVMLKNSAINNPKRYPDTHKRKVEYYLDKL